MVIMFVILAIITIVVVIYMVKKNCVSIKNFANKMDKVLPFPTNLYVKVAKTLVSALC